MGCLFFFRSKRNRREKQGRPRAGAGETLTAATTSFSSYDTSRSYGSTCGKQTSKSSASTSSQQSISAMFEVKGGNLRVFELGELRNATNGFSHMLKIGEGGFGSVYKGFIRAADGKGDRHTVAVKVLNLKGLQGYKEWVAEVHFLGVLEHPNLVKLIGYCSADGERGIQRLLVYEYMPNKSLEYHLFHKASSPLPWNLRLQIALGTAKGLAFLHEGLEVQVIYRDFKASNVLLDDDFQPRLSDFGLAREGPTGDRTHVSTAVVGTYGYAAPDYIETGHLTIKSDVWSFGVVLYELLTGRRSLDRNRPSNEQKLLDWVKQFPIESKRFNMVMDPRLSYQYSLKAAREMAKLANSCLSKQAKERPRMSQVVQILIHIVQINEATAAREAENKVRRADRAGG
ncbi:putative receptor-like protein kinase [Apostasia shenzhenica]|uniref:Putative receptor-like protein kinase n=1 Tax=Apostasia shenzhenica TaxID=1088818 RepID=A0A2H9ZS62_9ASPA|nr:putative receptor-like protein kinase [Apostasia shenzhenica]